MPSTRNGGNSCGWIIIDTILCSLYLHVHLICYETSTIIENYDSK